MNSKGQTLVVFVLLLPVLAIILTYLIDLSTQYIEKRNIENTVKHALKTNINITDLQKTKKLILKNNKNITNITITKTDAIIILELTAQIPSKLIKQKLEINQTYKVTQNNNKIKIEKE